MNELIRICTSACCLLTAQTQAGILFSDSFDGGASPLWGNEVGSWAAAAGVYFAEAPNNNPLTYTGLPFSTTDFTLELDINNVRDGGIWLRSIDNRNGVLLVTGGAFSGSTGLYWDIVINGAGGSSLNTVSGIFTPGVSDPHLKVEVAGNTYSVFVDGAATPATTLTTDAFSSGRIGLYNFSEQTFDNVVVTAVPEPAAFAVFGGCGLLLFSIFRSKTVGPKVEGEH